MARLRRIYDDRGAICSLNEAAPGVIFDAITGNPLNRGTEAWIEAVERLYALDGVQEVLEAADREDVDAPQG